jgi:signal transduction histidine kinase
VLYATSLVVYAFGALTLCVLSALYWGQRRSRTRRTGSVFPVFTLVCGAAFAVNLLAQTAVLPAGVMAMARNAAAGLLPPLVLQLVLELEPDASVWWRRMLVTFYAAGLTSAVVRGLYETGSLLTPAADLFYLAPAALLAVTGVAGSLLLARPKRDLPPGERWHRRWLILLLLLLLACAAANLAAYGAIAGQAPDYLLLVFFCVSLYYRERLVFIDLLLKRGAFLVAGMAALAGGVLMLRDGPVYVPFVLALGMWMIAPWVYGAVSHIVDRRWLRRSYSAIGAERQFIHDIQVAATEEELRLCATRSLRAIFQAEANVSDTNEAPGDEGLAARFESGEADAGWLILQPRPDGIPFLSDDRRLLQTLAGTFGVVLENVRFRVEQQRHVQREQQLRLLATRAELKALRAQINPHFLFNSLSAIAGLIQYQPELADETIEHLAMVFRYALRKSEHEWVLLGEEIEFVSAYLRVEQARFGPRLNVRLEVDPAAEQFPIPAMSIQPLIENAVRHGVSAMEAGGTITLRALLDGNDVCIEICDTGPGFPPDFCLDGQGHGLKNVSDRLQGYYGDAAHLSWQNAPGATRVLMRLPQARVAAGAQP